MPESDDAGALARFYESNRAHLKPWEPSRPDAFYTEAYWTERICLGQTDFMEERAAAFIFGARDASADEIIGVINLTQITRGPLNACMLGYAISHTAQGQGYMTEALRHVIQWAFDVLKLHRIHAGYLPTNTRSAQVLRRLGFNVEGYQRDYLYIDGAWRDHIQTGLINPDNAPPPNPH